MKTPVCSICAHPYNAVFEGKKENGETHRTLSPIVSTYLPDGRMVYVHKICLQQSTSDWKHVMQSSTRKQRREAIRDIKKQLTKQS